MELAIPAKTDAGRTEIETRALRLPTSLRSLLLLVDGQRPRDELDAIARRIHAPDDALAQLQTLGLVAMSAQADVEHAAVETPSAVRSDADTQRHLILYALMTDATRAHLGLVGGYLTQLKLERADDAHALAALLPTLQAALAKARDPGFAATHIAGIRAAAGLGPAA
ncbi:MAG: hypothetical protein ABW163_05880 [Luteimonas sp.]